VVGCFFFVRVSGRGLIFFLDCDLNHFPPRLHFSSVVVVCNKKKLSNKSRLDYYFFLSKKKKHLIHM